MLKNRVFDQPSSFLDMRGLTKIREASLDKDKKQESLHQAAKQLESVFMDMMLKSMRQANAVFSEDNMLDSQEGTMFREMLDKQYSQSLSNSSKFGLAEQIARQLDPTFGKLPLEKLSLDKPSTENPSDDTRGMKLPHRGGFSLLDAPTSCDLDASTPTAFVNSIMPYAKKAAAALGIDPRAIVAQAALETGWGKHVMDDKQGKSSLNLFGIKTGGAWTGNKATVETTEYRQNVAVREVADFRSYDNLEQTFNDYVSFLKDNPRYADALRNTRDGTDWGKHLQKAGYATDPEYGKKIAKLVMSAEISGAPKA